MKLILCLLFIIAGSAQANNFETIDLGQRFTVNDSETVPVSLSRRMFVRNLVIQAQGISTDATVEVMVNGEVKGTLYAPGRDPSYVVTISDWTSSIEFRHRHGGTFEVLDIKVTVSHQLPLPAVDEVEAMADSVIRLIGRLQPFSTSVENNNFLLPIKRMAGDVRIMNSAHGKLAYRTRVALIALQVEIEKANPYIDFIIDKNALFEDAVELLTIKETIREWLY